MFIKDRSKATILAFVTILFSLVLFSNVYAKYFFREGEVCEYAIYAPSTFHVIDLKYMEEEAEKEGIDFSGVPICIKEIKKDQVIVRRGEKLTKEHILLINKITSIYPNFLDSLKIKEIKALRLSVGKILLIKKGETYGAIRMTESTLDSAKYEWFFQPDGTMNFGNENVLKGYGELFVKYKIEETANGKNIYSEDLENSKVYIQFCDIKIRWDWDNWIYLSVESVKKDISVIITHLDNIEDILLYQHEFEETFKQLYQN